MGHIQTTEQSIVLRTETSGESFLKLHLLDREHGVMLCLKRLSSKTTHQNKPDLFDSAHVQLEKARQNTLYFLKDYLLITRRGHIGRSYTALKYASDFCSLIAHNGPHMADPYLLFSITERMLNALSQKDAADIIYIKALYLLLRDEGYPVRESWWPTLPHNKRTFAQSIINSPIPKEVEQDICSHSESIIEHLLYWMERETDLKRP